MACPVQRKTFLNSGIVSTSLLHWAWRSCWISAKSSFYWWIGSTAGCWKFIFLLYLSSNSVYMTARVNNLRHPYLRVPIMLYSHYFKPNNFILYYCYDNLKRKTVKSQASIFSNNLHMLILSIVAEFWSIKSGQYFTVMTQYLISWTLRGSRWWWGWLSWLQGSPCAAIIIRITLILSGAHLARGINAHLYVKSLYVWRSALITCW